MKVSIKDVTAHWFCPMGREWKLNVKFHGITGEYTIKPEKFLNGVKPTKAIMNLIVVPEILNKDFNLVYDIVPSGEGQNFKLEIQEFITTPDDAHNFFWDRQEALSYLKFQIKELEEKYGKRQKTA